MPGNHSIWYHAMLWTAENVDCGGGHSPPRCVFRAWRRVRRSVPYTLFELMKEVGMAARPLSVRRPPDVYYPMLFGSCSPPLTSHIPECEYRWTDHLDPSLDRSPWTSAEEALFLQLASQSSTPYAAEFVKSKFPGRPPAACRERYSTLQSPHFELTARAGFGIVRS
jgi:hypothetical protein